MSSRYYPRYLYGNPQLRIFLPDFWMILVKEKRPNALENRVTFRVHPRMTENDVRNYLSKIYKLEVADIKSMLRPGEMPQARGRIYMTKKYDYRLVHVQLPVGTTFKHPNEDLFSIDGKMSGEEEFQESIKKLDEKFDKYKAESITTGPNLPTWWFKQSPES